VDILIIAVFFIMSVIGISGKIFETRQTYLEFRGQKGFSGVLAFFAAIPALLFLIAGPFDMLSPRTYFWVCFLGLLWLTLLHERLRHRMAGDDPKSFIPLLTEKLAEMGGWVFAGGVLGLLMLFLMYTFTPTYIGTARTVLVHLKAGLKFLKLGGGATILLLAAVLMAQWRFPKRKEKLERLWRHWTSTQKYLKRALLVMTSLCCFSYTGTFRGGAITPLLHKIDLVEQNYRELVWRTEIELSADLRIDAYREEYTSYSPQLQSAIQAEVSTGQRAARLPAKYLPAHFVGYSGELPSDFRSDGDSTLINYSMFLDQEYSDNLPVPYDVPMAGLLTEKPERPRAYTDAIPDWLEGLPGELAEKIIDRVLDLENITFIERFSDEFPLVGSLIGTVDGQLNAALTEKMKTAAARIAHRRARQQIDHFDAEHSALTSQAPHMHTRAALQSHIAESRAIAKVVASAEPVAASDLRTAIQKELAQAAKRRLENGEEPPPEEEKVRLKNQKTVEELTKKYGYEYLLRLQKYPGSALRVGADGSFVEHELPLENEVPHPRPEPIMPREFEVP
jgi:hypothetical protein